MYDVKGLPQNDTSDDFEFEGGTAIFVVVGVPGPVSIALEYEYPVVGWKAYEPEVATIDAAAMPDGVFQQGGLFLPGSYRLVNTGGDGTTLISSNIYKVG